MFMTFIIVVFLFVIVLSKYTGLKISGSMWGVVEGQNSMTESSFDLFITPVPIKFLSKFPK